MSEETLGQLLIRRSTLITRLGAYCQTYLDAVRADNGFSRTRMTYEIATLGVELAELEKQIRRTEHAETIARAGISGRA